MAVGKAKNPKEKLVLGLHILTLSGFAIAQPLYDLLAQYPTFLVAGGASAPDILGLAFLISVALPGLMVLHCWLAGLLSNIAYKGLHYLFVFSFFVLAVFPLIEKLALLPEIAQYSVLRSISKLSAISRSTHIR